MSATTQHRPGYALPPRTLALPLAIRDAIGTGSTPADSSDDSNGLGSALLSSPPASVPALAFGWDRITGESPRRAGHSEDGEPVLLRFLRLRAGIDSGSTGHAETSDAGRYGWTAQTTLGIIGVALVALLPITLAAVAISRGQLLDFAGDIGWLTGLGALILTGFSVRGRGPVRG